MQRRQAVIKGATVNIEDEMNIALAESYLNAAFERLSKCFFAQESQPFGVWCAAQVMAAAKLVQRADFMLLGLRGNMEYWDCVHQRLPLNGSAQAQVAIMQAFYRQLGTSSWLEMPQEHRIQHACEAFAQVKQAMQQPSSSVRYDDLIAWRRKQAGE
jgi:hypothetical protein